MSIDPNAVKDIFSATADLPTSQRDEFLTGACANDAELRARVEALLQALDDSGSGLPVNVGVTETYAQRSDGPERDHADDRIGPYRLVRKLGEGGMGVVWLAEQLEPVRRQVALKLIKPGMDSAQIIARFESERQALAVMNHPNIARVFDGGRIAGTGIGGRSTPYFVMELVEGTPITKYCDEHRLTLRERLELFVQVCQAVQHAHQKGVIHRDLKPTNVLVGSADGRAVPKVIDFGVAKATGIQLHEQSIHTEAGTVVGTLEYMAPEQAELNNADIDTRADVYSLGVILYELLTGSPPFSRQQLREKGFTEMLRVIREVEPAKPSTKLSSSEQLPTIAANRKLEPRRLTNSVHGDLDWIVMKCLEKDRTRRYETANGLAQELRRFLGDEPVLAGPPSRWYRINKFVRRNRRAVLAASLLAFALVAGVIGTTWGMLRARAESQQKELARVQADEQRDRAEEVSRFLENDLLELADSRRQAGASMLADPDLKVKTLVVRAAQRIEGKFAGKPAVELALRTTIGNALRSVGESELSIPQFERARQLNSQLFGATSMETMYCMSFLARSLMNCGKLDEAKPVCEQILEHCQSTLGERHVDTLSAANDLALLHQLQGDLKRALPIFERTLELRSETLGPDHVETLLSMNNLGYCYFGLAQYDKSLAMHQRTHQLRLAKFGEDNPDTIISLNNVATALLSLGAIPRALPLLEKSLELHKKRMGMGHPDTWHSMDNLSWTYQALGQHERSIALGEEALKLRLAKHGSDHHDTFQSWNNVGSSYYADGQFERALTLHQQAYQGRLAKLGELHQHTLVSMHNVAMDHLALGSADLAIPLLQKAHELNRKTFEADHPVTLRYASALAAAYLEAGQVPRSVTLLEEILKLRQANLPPNHPETLRSMSHLARAYQTNGQHDQSIPLHQQTLETRRAVLGKDHADTLASVSNLAIDYLSVRRFAEAESILREGLVNAQPKHATAWNTFQMQCLLGTALAGQEKFVEAEPQLLQGYGALKKQSGAMFLNHKKKRLVETVESLIQLYNRTGKLDKETEWSKALNEMTQ